MSYRKYNMIGSQNHVMSFTLTSYITKIIIIFLFYEREFWKYPLKKNNHKFAFGQT